MPVKNTEEWRRAYGDLQHFGKNLPDRHVLYLPDYWTVLNERPKLANDLRRIPENALTGKVSEQERFKGLPPIGSREVFIGFTGQKAAEEEIRRAEAILDEHREQIELKSDILTSLNVAEAVRQALVDREGNVRFPRETFSMPFQCELILTECKSAERDEKMVSGERSRSLLQAVVEKLAEDWIECVKLVGNTHDYYYGTRLIMDEKKAFLWPDDKSMTRVVSFLTNDFTYERKFQKSPPEFHGTLEEYSEGTFSETILKHYFRSSSWTIWSGPLPEDPPAPGMLRPSEYTRPMSTFKIWIDSFSDMVSTVAAAIRYMDDADIENWRNGGFWGMFKDEVEHEIYELRWIYAQFREAINFKVEEEDEEMEIVLLKAHLIASMFDASRYGEFKNKLYENITKNSLVVKKLHDKLGSEPQPIQLPRENLTSFWNDEKLAEIENAANAAISTGSEGIRIKSKKRPPHAGRVLDGTIQLEEGREENVCDIDIVSGQATQLESENKENYRTIQVSNKRIRYHIKLKKRGDSVAYKGTSRFSLMSRMLGGAISRVGEVSIAKILKVDPEKWWCYSCELDEVLNVALSGDCSEGDSRWALTAILSRAVKVSNKSTVRYVPSNLMENEEGVVLDANLDAELVEQLPMVIVRGEAPTIANEEESSDQTQERNAEDKVYTQLTRGKDLFRVVPYGDILDFEPLSVEEQMHVRLRGADVGVLKYSIPVGGMREPTQSQE